MKKLTTILLAILALAIAGGSSTNLDLVILRLIGL